MKIFNLFLYFSLFFHLKLILSEVNLIIKYPVKLLPPVNGISFNGIINKNNLYCFGNQDYPSATFLESIYCIIGINKIYNLYQCYSLWGRRSVSINVQGSVEFFKTKQLPRESNQLLNVTHWLHLNSDDINYYNYNNNNNNNDNDNNSYLNQSKHSYSSYSDYNFNFNQISNNNNNNNINNFENHSIVQEIKYIEADPFYLCVRCNDWRDDATAKFSLKLRPAYIRHRARAICLKKMIFGALYLIGLSISWLSPLLKASWAAIYVFTNGLQVFILLVTISIVTVLFTPFILTKKNRSYVRSAYQLFFSTVKSYPLPQDELEQDYRQAWLLFHAFYFSCIIVCIGCVATYVSFIYFGFNREIRNNLLRFSLSLATTAFIYFTSRMFEIWSNRIATIALIISIVSSVRQNINPGSKDEVVVAVIFYTVLLQLIITRVSSFPRIVQISEMFHREMNSLKVDLLGHVFSASGFSKSIGKKKSNHLLHKLPNIDNSNTIIHSTSQSLIVSSSESNLIESSINSITFELKVSLLGPVKLIDELKVNSFYIPSLTNDQVNISSQSLFYKSIENIVWYSRELNLSSSNYKVNGIHEIDETNSNKTIIQLKLQLKSSKDLQTLISEINIDKQNPSQSSNLLTLLKETCKIFCLKNNLKFHNLSINNIESNLLVDLQIIISSIYSQTLTTSSSLSPTLSDSPSSPSSSLPLPTRNSIHNKNNNKMYRELIQSLIECIPFVRLNFYSINNEQSTEIQKKNVYSSLQLKSSTSFPIGLSCKLKTLNIFDNLMKEHEWFNLSKLSSNNENNEWKSILLTDLMNVIYCLQLPSSCNEQLIQFINRSDISFHLEKENIITIIWPNFDSNLSFILSLLTTQERTQLQQNISKFILSKSSNTNNIDIESKSKGNKKNKKNKEANNHSNSNNNKDELIFFSSIEIWLNNCLYYASIVSYLSFLSRK